MNKPKTFILTGRSGSGKGTQAKILEQFLKIHSPSIPVLYIETGVKFREFVQGQSVSSKLAKEIYALGERQPDFLAVWNWAHVMIEEMSGHEHIIIDGTPRSLEEAEVLDSAMTFYKREQPYVLHLDVTREWSRHHIETRAKKEGRIDDQSQREIDRRLDWFETDVARAIKFYQNHRGYQYVMIDGERTVEEVAKSIQDAVSL